MANPQDLDQKDVKVYIRCRTCGTQNCFEEIPPRRVDLALFRGAEDPTVKCRGCYAAMDTMTAFCGVKVGSDVLRREDPGF